MEYPDLTNGNNFTMSRVESFSDCIFAFAITLLVINLRLPGVTVSSSAINIYLLRLWPTFVAFLLSFWVIYRFWSAHVKIFKYYREASSTFLTLNAFLMLFIISMPFTTDVLSLYPRDSVGVVLYAAIFSIAAFLEAALWEYTKKHPELLHKPVDIAEIDSCRNNTLTSAFIFAASIPIGLFRPYLTELLWLLALLIKIKAKPRAQHVKKV